MKLRVLLLLASMLFVDLMASDGFAAEEGAVRQDVNVVRALYEDFAGEAVLDSPEAQKQLLDQPQAVLERYFTPELALLIRQDRECVARTREICQLDFSPIWDSQDPSGATVNIAGKPIVGEVVAEVRYPNGETRKLLYRLSKVRAAWRIADIVYGDNGASLARMLRVGR